MSRIVPELVCHVSLLSTKTCQLGKIARIARPKTFQHVKIFLISAAGGKVFLPVKKKNKNGIVAPKDMPLRKLKLDVIEDGFRENLAPTRGRRNFQRSITVQGRTSCSFTLSNDQTF